MNIFRRLYVDRNSGDTRDLVKRNCSSLFHSLHPFVLNYEKYEALLVWVGWHRGETSICCVPLIAIHVEFPKEATVFCVLQDPFRQKSADEGINVTLLCGILGCRGETALHKCTTHAKLVSREWDLPGKYITSSSHAAVVKLQYCSLDSAHLHSILMGSDNQPSILPRSINWIPSLFGGGGNVYLM